MPLAINFRWNVPTLDKPQTMAEKTGWNDAMKTIGDTGRYLRSRMDKEAADKIAAEDRQRRIAEEDRQKKLYGDAANAIRGKVEERARLVERRNQIVARLEQLKGGA